MMTQLSTFSAEISWWDNIGAPLHTYITVQTYIVTERGEELCHPSMNMLQRIYEAVISLSLVIKDYKSDTVLGQLIRSALSALVHVDIQIKLATKTKGAEYKDLLTLFDETHELRQSAIWQTLDAQIGRA